MKFHRFRPFFPYCFTQETCSATPAGPVVQPVLGCSRSPHRQCSRLLLLLSEPNLLLDHLFEHLRNTDVSRVGSTDVFGIFGVMLLCIVLYILKLSARPNIFVHHSAFSFSFNSKKKQLIDLRLIHYIYQWIIQSCFDHDLHYWPQHPPNVATSDSTFIPLRLSAGHQSSVQAFTAQGAGNVTW